VTGDPIGTGLVASLARPGGNATGLSNFAVDLAAKRLEILRDVFPSLAHLAIIANSAYSGGALELGEIQAAARALGIEVIPLVGGGLCELCVTPFCAAFYSRFVRSQTSKLSSSRFECG